MKDLTFITGNEGKAKYLALWLGKPIERQKLDLAEIQSLDLEEVVRHKVTAAFNQLGRPVLVEDVALTFHALGQLPGTLIKWFLEELGTKGLCHLLNEHEERLATAEIVYGLHDGLHIHYFRGKTAGRITDQPRGSLGFGWNAIFIPEGSDKTYAEMADEELEQFSFRAKAIDKLRAFLDEKEIAA